AGASQDLADEPLPGFPVRRVAVERKDPAIDHRVAAEPVRRPPTKRAAVVFPRQRQAEEFWPLVMALVGAVDLRGDRQTGRPGRGAVQVDDAQIRDQSVGVEPQIYRVAGEMTRQKRARDLRLECLGSALVTGEIDIPARLCDASGALGQPAALVRGE